MIFLRSALVKGALIAVVASSAVAVASTPSASVVCNRKGDCWHVRERLDYPAGIGITFHDDAWGIAHHHGRIHWRADRVDHSRYRNAVWIAL